MPLTAQSAANQPLEDDGGTNFAARIEQARTEVGHEGHYDLVLWHVLRVASGHRNGHVPQRVDAFVCKPDVGVLGRERELRGPRAGHRAKARCGVVPDLRGCKKGGVVVADERADDPAVGERVREPLHHDAVVGAHDLAPTEQQTVSIVSAAVLVRGAK